MDADIVDSRSPRVCVIGNLNIDFIVRGVEAFPNWGQEVAASSSSIASAGQGGGLAIGLARLGVPVSVVGNVGDDHFGHQIIGDLTQAGVDSSQVEISRTAATCVSIGVVRPDGERAFISDFACMREFNRESILRAWPAIEQADLVCLVGMFCFPSLTLDDALWLLQTLKAAGKTTVLDTGWDPDQWPGDTIAAVRAMLAFVDIFLPNREEARALTGESTVEAAAKSLQACGAGQVVIKCGPDGAFALDGNDGIWSPAMAACVRDTVGAGDAFNAGFLAAFRETPELAGAMAMGNAVASIYVSRLTNRHPPLAEVRALLP